MATFRVMRYNPEKDDKPYFQTYEVPVKEGMTILDALIYIKENLDSTFTFRASCRMGICGSCAVYVNGLPRLACETQIQFLKSETIEVRPLPNYEVIKDLVVDQSNLFAKHREVKPWIISRDAEASDRPAKEYLQTPEEQEMYLQFSYCISCGICLAACPTAATDTAFLGPQALAQAYRYTFDTRDDGAEERFAVLDQPHGLWKCHMAGACSHACPKGVDPALALQLLKRAALFGHKKPKARIMDFVPKYNPRPDIPKAPEPTVKRG